MDRWRNTAGPEAERPKEGGRGEEPVAIRATVSSRVEQGFALILLLQLSFYRNDIKFSHCERKKGVF